MEFHEGCRRLRVAGRSLTLIGFGLLIIGTLITMFMGLLPHLVLFLSLRLINSFMFYVVWMAAVLGILLWLAAWISEGFAASPHTESDPR